LQPDEHNGLGLDSTPLSNSKKNIHNISYSLGRACWSLSGHALSFHKSY